MDNHHQVLEGPENSPRLNRRLSRRQVLKLGGISLVGASALAPLLAQSAAKPLIIMEQARGILIADPATCVGCGRCELACTEFNDGRAAPIQSRIKVDRNISFGRDALLGWREAQGAWGNGLVVQDICNQCPHPVPCADICPEDAIVVAPSTGARMVDVDKCTGCKICLKACPWEMISYDPELRKATKCDLCNGKPKCVEACPAEALSYMPWRDLTGKTPSRVNGPALPQGDRARSCFECHLPGQKRSGSLAAQLFTGATRPLRSRTDSAFSWIDRVGTIFMPITLLLVVAHAAARVVVRGRDEAANSKLKTMRKTDHKAGHTEERTAGDIE